MNYTLKSKLGEGGMATVHLAEDHKFHTEVAVKMLKKEFVNNENIKKRFLAEARSMFRMSHPHVIRVSDLIDEGDTVAFVMEYVAGETLKEHLDRKGALPDNEIRDIFSQMLDAVGYVHEQKMVHRDIKPSNFMIDKKGKVKLMDFGIAKNTDQNAAEYTQTGTGMMMGTPMYMSPEQITETKSVTAQSDIYSLGIVLWQMVAGKKPYDTKTLSNFQLQIKIVQEPLEVTNTDWDRIIQKATEKEMEKRFQDCLDFGNNLSLSKKEKKVAKSGDKIEQAVEKAKVNAEVNETTLIENFSSKEIVGDNKIDLFLKKNAQNFTSQDLLKVKEKLLQIDDKSLELIQNLKFENPSTILAIAILVGWERFWLEDKLIGGLKIIINLLFVIFIFPIPIWTVIDIFTAKKRARNYNFKKFTQVAFLK